MADTEPPPTTDITFRGTDGNECEAFVVAIRDLAFTKGKDEDSNWMLRYATTRLRHKALRWHAKLDPSIRKDWDLFVQALFEEYPLVEESDTGGIVTPIRTSSPTSPAVIISGNNHLHTSIQPEGLSLGALGPHGSLSLSGAPIPPRLENCPLLQGYQAGRLRILYEEGISGPYYISCGQQAESSEQVDTKHVTTNVHDALTVIFTSSPEPHQIGCTNSKRSQTWNLGTQLFSTDISKLHPLVGAQNITAPFPLDTTYRSHEYQIVSSIWNVLPDGTLRATLAELERLMSHDTQS